MTIDLDPSHDWQSSDAYRGLLNLDHCGWAWEFLRRNPNYRSVAPMSNCRTEVYISSDPQIRVIETTMPHTEARQLGLRFR